MEVNSKEAEYAEDEEEYVLLDLDGVAAQVDIPPNASYVLSGLDTLNPVLIIGDKVKLATAFPDEKFQGICPGLMIGNCNYHIGEYEETIGTCYVFSESDAAPVIHEETGTSEANLFMGKCIADPNQAPTKNVKPVASLQKILKFRLPPEVDISVSAVEPTDSNL